MKNISENIKNALKQEAVTTTARITVLPDNTVIDGNNLSSVKIVDKCYNEGVIIGTSMCKEVEIEIINNNYQLENKEFILEVGVLLENGTYEYISYGNFIVKEYNDLKSNNRYKIIAYDYMDKLNVVFEDNYDYSTPITLQRFYENFADFYGIEFVEQTLPNQNFSIIEKPYFENMTGRVVLSRIAEMFGSFAKFNSDNKLQMYLTNTTNEQITRNEMNSSLEINNMFGPINVVALRLSDVEGENVTLRDEDSILTYGEKTLQIYDNPFTYTQALREAAIQGIYNRVKGFSYYPTKFNSKLIYFDCGDIVNVQDMKTDNFYPTMILNQTLQVPNTIKCKFENSALTDNALKYQFISEQAAKNRRTEYIIDKQNQTITQIVEEVESILVTTYEAEGKNIHIEDSAEEPFVDISLRGESIQEGTPTPDAPVDIENIEGDVSVKINGKNLCNIYHLYEVGYSTTINGITYTVNDDGSITANGTATANSSFYVYNNANPLHLLSGTYRLSGENSAYSSIAIRGFYYTSDGTQKYVGSSNYFTTTEEIDLRIYIIILSGQTIDNLKFYPMVEVGQEISEYEGYKEQTVTFALGEEKLYEGSYLADDGKHHNRGQIIYDGSDDEAWTMVGTRFYIVNSEIVIESSNAEVTVICDKLKGVSYGYLYTNNGTDYLISNCGTSGGSNRLFVSTNIEETGIETVEGLKTWLSENPITVEYELAEEEIVPYTEDQQEAWNTIKAMTTYKNITNITSTAYAKIVYMRDNGLDVYETKQNAENNYIETNEKLAEQKITTDTITTTVSETVTRLNNDYLTAEQVNAELDTAKDDIEVLQQKQAQTELTSEGFKVQIDSIINDGVSKVKTSIGYTFGDDGLIINKEDAETGTIIDEASVRVIDKTGSEEQDLLYAGYVKEDNEDYPNYVGQTIVASTNMIVQNYLVVPNSRFEAYENPVLGGKGTGAFDV